jgi:hypothetical protein
METTLRFPQVNFSAPDHLFDLSRNLNILSLQHASCSIISVFSQSVAPNKSRQRNRRHADRQTHFGQQLIQRGVPAISDRIRRAAMMPFSAVLKEPPSS